MSEEKEVVYGADQIQILEGLEVKPVNVNEMVLRVG